MPNSSLRQSYGILGAGALGAYYGARLHAVGYDVHFLLHSDFDHVHRHGLRVESKDGDFSIAKPNIYRAAADMPKCDVVLVGLKTTQNDALPQILPPVVREGGIVLVMQNGLGIEEDVASIVGPSVHVAGGLAFLCSNKVGSGHICHLDYGHVRLGEYTANGKPAGVTPRITQLAEDFSRAGLPVDVEEDLLLARWKKLVWNIPFNGLSVVLNTTTDLLVQHESTRQLCETLMNEVVAGAAGYGRTIEPAFVQQMLDWTDKMVAYKPSMKLDADKGRPLEIEAIYGNPLRAAAAKGVPMPCTEMLYRQLRFVDSSGE